MKKPETPRNRNYRMIIGIPALVLGTTLAIVSISSNSDAEDQYYIYSNGNFRKVTFKNASYNTASDHYGCYQIVANSDKMKSEIDSTELQSLVDKKQIRLTK